MNYLFIEIDNEEGEEIYYELLRIEDSGFTLDEAYEYCVNLTLASAEVINRNDQAIRFTGVDTDGDPGEFLVMVYEDDDFEFDEEALDN